MIKKLASCIGEYKKEVIATPIFVAAEVVMDIIVPILMANMIDYGINNGNMNVIMKTGLTLLLMCTFALVFGVLSGRSAAIAAAGFAKNLRQRMYQKIQDFTFTSIDKFSTTGLVTRLTTDVTNVQNAFQMIIRVCARSPLMIIFAIFMVLKLNASLAWIFVAIIPFLAVGLMLIIFKANPLFIKVFDAYDHLNNVVQENIRGIRVVKSYVREDYETQKFKNTSNNIFANFVKAEKVLAFNNPLMQFSMYTCTLLISWFGAKMIVSDTFTTGQLMSLLTYASQILVNLMMLSMALVMVIISKASAERIAEVLDEEIDMENGTVKVVADGSISFKDVSFGYHGGDKKLCLQNINLEIASGQTVGVIGGTGSGKTSLVQLIPRLYDVTGGVLEVGGKDVKQYDIEALREEVAMVLQKNILFAGTIKENMRWGKKDATDEEIEHACALAQADEFISQMPDGYDTWIEQGGSNVSGGQRQRLCIARALIKSPKILILDDSTSAVDTKTDAAIRKAFKDVIPGTTKIIIAQRISSVEEADQIIVMDNGQISDIGTHEKLLQTSEIYKEVYESQQKGGMSDDPE